MFGIIVALMLAAAAVAAALTLVSETFADGVSRYAEAAMDAVEYRLALHDKRRAGRGEGDARGVAAGYEPGGALSW
jgi:hypothetical protein